jgi:hypothetical protein
MVDLIPRKVLFGNPERISPHISPDGTRLAWIAPDSGVLNVWVAPIGADGVGWDAAQVVTDDRDRGIRAFAWARDNRHLLYVQDTGGDENWRLYDVDMQTLVRRDLTPFDGIQARIIATRKSHRDRGTDQADREPRVRGLARRRGHGGPRRAVPTAHGRIRRAGPRRLRGRLADGADHLG